MIRLVRCDVCLYNQMTALPAYWSYLASAADALLQKPQGVLREAETCSRQQLRLQGNLTTDSV